VFTLNALEEYVSPVPAVVVAPLDTTPPNTARPPVESDGSDSVPIEAKVVDELTNDPYVVDEKLNLFTPLQKLVSARRVDEAALPDDGSTYTIPDELVFRKPAEVVENVAFPTTKFVVLAVTNDPYVVDEKLNLFTPLQKLVSASNVVEAVLSVDVIVIGAEPNATNCVHDVEPEHDTVVVAVVLSSPPVPRYATPCDSDDSRSGPENVDDAVENRPPVRPSVVDVLAPYAVNGRM